MNTTNVRLQSLGRLVLSLVLVCFSAVGRTQDVEIFSGSNPSGTAKPNVLIVIDNSANWSKPLPPASSAWDPELKAVSDSINALLANGFGNKVRVGVMFGTHSNTRDGGYVRYAIRDMNVTNAGQLSNLMLNIRAYLLSGATGATREKSSNPNYSQMMNEAYLYFFGKPIGAGFSDEKRDCSAANLNNKVAAITSPSGPAYDLTTLGSYAYTSCGTDAYNSNKFADSTTNMGVSYVGPPDVNGVCQRNFIIFVGNGPVSNQDDNPGLALLQSAITAEGGRGSTTVIPVTPSGEAGSNFSDEWARFLNQIKNVQTYTINVQPSGGQSANHDALMRSMATNGGGDNCDATNPVAIQECLDATFNKILAVNSVFTSVTLPVSVNPQLQNLDQVYMGMFRPDPEGNPRWFGNLKQYRLDIDINGNPRLVDSAGSLAIDSVTGQVAANTISYWTSTSSYWSYKPSGTPPSSSDSPDGPLVEKGGAAERLRIAYAASGTTSNVANRKVFTCVGCSTQTALTGGTDTSTGSTSFSSANVATLQASLRTSTSTEASSLIKWVRGENTVSEKTDGVAVEVRPSIHGDVLHSRPAVLTVSDSEIYLFYGSNDGMLHAIKGGRGVTGGDEIWSFIPEEFFPRLQRLRDNAPVSWSFNTISTSATLVSGSATATVGSTTGITVGMFVEGTTNIPKNTFVLSVVDATHVTLSQAALGAFSGTLRFVPDAKPAFADGSVVIYKDPTNNKTYLFASMRRGGRFLYAFDITSPTAPLFLWRKGCDHAGISANNGYGCDTGYDELGQTWSLPQVARIGTQSDYKTVLIFGGGYDAYADDPDPALTASGTRTMGFGVFVVDAYTGAVLSNGHIRPSKMDFATPGDITLADLDRDGFVDRLYYGDTGGQLWRTDTNGNKDPNSWTTQRIASLGLGQNSGLSGPENGRKFLFAPDVVETSPGSGIYAILVASGDRENPLNGATGRSSTPVVVNRIYMILDGPVRGNNAVTESNLEDRTTNTIGAPTASLGGNVGWFVTMTVSGEKGTGSITTLAGTSYIGTNYPVPPDANSCSTTVGNARFYTLDFLTSAGRGNGVSSTIDLSSNRYTDVVGGGMPPSPVGTIIQTSNNQFVQAVIMGTKVLTVGPAKVGDRFRNFWYKMFDKK